MSRTFSATAAFLVFVLSFAGAGTAAAQSEVTIQKFTNGQDADLPPGPSVIVGSTVNWTYVVTNSGSRPITNIEVTDDQGVVVTCPATTLDAGESMTCTASGVAQSGQYTNIGTVTALLLDQTEVTDSDPSHYFGQSAPSVAIEKRTNGDDADTPPGPSVPVASTVNWDYEITNIGDEDLINIVVTDDQGVSVSCPGTTLAVGASMTCTASGVAQPGQYANLGTVSATRSPSAEAVVASDPSHYFGQTLQLIKRTNGVEAPVPPGPSVDPGSVVTWTYEVTNPGPAAVTGLSVTDDQGVVVTCSQTTLAASESITCSGSGTAQPGQYSNLGTATATLPSGAVVTATDQSFYFANALAIQKLTNGVDADVAPGPSVAVGSTVAWTYVVTNLAEDTVTGVTVTDDQGVVVTCPATTLAPGESMTCTGSGVAVSGQYANVGTAEATSGTLGSLSASDPSHYFGQTQVLDFGDAPDPSFPVLFASNGARHILGGGVYLGACVDSEADGLTSAGATGDDSAAGTEIGTCATAGDDEDGVTFTTQVVIGQTASIDVVASAPCTLSAWIDFEGDGDWGGVDEELFPGGTALAAGVSSLNFAVPATAVAGSATARFRCTTDGAVSFAGEASDGEVEDYTVTIVTPTPSIAATKTDALQIDVDGDGFAEPGDTLRYTIVITNSGTGDATGVVVTDTPDGNTALLAGSVTTTSGSVTTGNGGGDTNVIVSVGTIAPYGGSATITFDVTVDDPLPLGVTSVSNQGTVSGTNFENVLTNATVTALTVPPSVAATKSDALVIDVDGDGLAEPGDTLEYTIVITNSGTGDATSVAFNDTPDANTALVAGSVTTTAGSVTTGNGGGDTSVSVAVGTLAGLGGTATITFRVTIDDPLPLGVTSVSNQGTVSGANFADVLTNATVTALTVPPSVAATKSDALVIDVDGDGLAEPGDTLEYTIVITNSGTGDATSVAFNDTPDANTALVTGTVTTTAGSVTTGNGGGDTSVSVAVGTLAGLGGTATITFRVTIDDPLPLGVTSVSNQGTVSGTNFENVLTNATVTALTVPPSVAATKSDALVIDVDGDGLAEPGDTLEYTIVITNSGTGDATSVAFNDTPDANTALVAGSVTTTAGSVTTGNGGGDTSVSVAVGTLAGLGGTATITFRVTIDDPLPLGVTSVSNQGTVSGTNFADVLTNTTVTALTVPPSVSATKTVALSVDADGDGSADPGDTLHYIITIVNAGTGDAFGVVFDDTPDPNSTLVNGSVTTTTGVVTTGNTAGDATVSVAAGTLAGLGGTATITFDVTIADFPTGVFQIANFGTVTGTNFAPLVTDDPSQPGSSDVTVFATGVSIPTLETWFLLALMTMLGGIAMRRI